MIIRADAHANRITPTDIIITVIMMDGQLGRWFT